VEVLVVDLTWQGQQHSRAILEVGLTTTGVAILHLEAPLVRLDNQAQRPR
jgi:hypothetical protein